jgi:hypothetical protein
MAKYDPQFLKELITSDDPDILVPEFIARATEKLASAGSAIHDCQQETIQSTKEIATELGLAKISHQDPFFAAVLESHRRTTEAQSAMWESLADIGQSLAKVVKRM